MKKTLITTTALVAAAGATVLVATPAHADVERRGTCAGATYELSVDRERGGFEVDADLDRARPGSTWTVTLRHDGAVATSRTLRADAEGEIDVDTWRRDTAGTDTFRLTVRPAGGTACSTRATLR
jgi:hypothetical protein